ncbi:MAG: YwaF family protein [Firmicutes bacterium]|nr:YwaF family protein [Bacillota bacterium]
MTIIEQVLQFLASEMNKPILYQDFSQSWFQYLSLLLMIILTVILVKHLKGASVVKVRKYLFIFSIILITFEIYKQIIFTYQGGWNYQWYAFPFQFCSTPMYVALYASLTKNKKLREMMIAFLGTFGLFAGLAVMLYPVSVYVTTIGINIQTMVHHGSMAAIGFALLATQIKLESKTIIKAAPVFITLVFIALILNLVHNTWIQDGTFNMFFINSIHNNDLPILNMIQPVVPYFIYLLVYTFGFTFVAYIVLLVGIFVKRVQRVKEYSSSYSQES